MENFVSCHDVDGEFFAHCRKIETLPNLQVDGCRLIFNQDNGMIIDGTPEYNMLLSQARDVRLDEQKNAIDCSLSMKFDVQTNLKRWIEKASDIDLIWHHFTTEHEPFDFDNPRLDISFPDSIGRIDSRRNNFLIYSAGGKLLLSGKAIDGKILVDIDDHIASHPGWKTRITIAFTSSDSDFDLDGLNIGFDSGVSLHVFCVFVYFQAFLTVF